MFRNLNIQKFTLLLFGLFIFYCLGSEAQITKENQIDIVIDDDIKEAYVVDLVSDNNFAVLLETDIKIKGDREWKLDFYDKEFSVEKSVLLEGIGKNFTYKISKRLGDNLYFLFDEYNDKHILVTVNLNELTAFKIDIDEEFSKVNDIVEQNGIVYILKGEKTPPSSLSNIKKMEPKVYQVNLKSGEVVVSNIEVEDFKRKKLVSSNIIISEKEVMSYFVGMDKITTQLFIKTWNQEGIGTPIKAVSEAVENRFLQIKIHPISSGQLVYGTYSNLNDNFSYSEGFFFLQVENGVQTKLNFISNNEIESFNSFMAGNTPKTTKAVNKIVGAESDEFKVYLHEIVPFSDGYVLLGEAYFPPKTEVQTFPVMSHGLIIKVDKNGQLLWDETISLRESWSNHTVENKYKMEMIVNDKGDLTLLTDRNEQWEYKEIGMDGTVIQESLTDNLSISSGEKLIFGKYSGFFHWQKNSFIHYSRLKKKGVDGKSVEALSIVLVNL